MKKYIFITLAMLVFVSSTQNAVACTSILVTKKASKDGSTMLTYAADSYSMYGELYHYPAMTYLPGTMLKVYEWDTPGKYLGEIPQVISTYNVIGNMNEYQLAITETTFGGREQLGKANGILDYGSLIFITLQRAKTAREAIKIMTDLVSKYGYASSGETFSIADKEEVWIMEMIGKGEKEKGAVWVALKVPDGYVCAHANQSRITTFPLKDKENCLYSKDVITFAKKQGYFTGKNEDFNFSEAYAPLDFGAVRFCDARVWSVYNRIDREIGKKYELYATGKDLKAERLPLWIEPKEKLSARDLMNLMRDHYEGTPLDFTEGLGAGPYQTPYRNRPLLYKIGDKEYFNERPISTQQTGYSIVTQSRGYLPDTYGGLLWFGVDDTYMTCYTPVYTSSTRVAYQIAQGNGDLLTYSPTSAFWVFNRVSNFVYPRYNVVIDDLKAKQKELEDYFESVVKKTDDIANTLTKYNKPASEIVEYVTNVSEQNAAKMVSEWDGFENYLLVKYIDGIRRREKDGQFERQEGIKAAASPINPGYSQKWLQACQKDEKDRYAVPKEEK